MGAPSPGVTSKVMVLPTGRPMVHTHSPWGAQIGIDLLNAAIAGLVLGAPLARQYRFRLWPYVVLTFATGSPGVLALAARVLYARHAASKTKHETTTGLQPSSPVA